MTQEAHTPTPWYIDGDLEIRAPDILDDGTNQEPWVVAQVAMGCGFPDCNDVANARRIVASVNALSNIPVEAIESGVVAELVEALHTIRDGNQRPGHVAYLSKDSMARIADVALAKVGCAS